MKLHLNPTLFRQAIQFTSDKLNILPIYIEKDYWVTFALYTIFHAEIGKDTVFKGGTSLSKCYKMIERFSEDIDLVVLRREGDTGNRLTTKLKTIGKVVSAVLPEVVIEGLTQKMGMNRKTAHAYQKVFNVGYGHVRDVIVLEATWLGYFEPFTSRPLVSLIGEAMLDNNQPELVQEHGLDAFNVQVLEPVRTICEKIMSLVRFSYAEDPIETLKKKVRHCYDLNRLLSQKEFSGFFDSDGFEKMLLKVAADDVESFKNNNDWLVHHPKDALIFSRAEQVWIEIKSSYTGDFRNLVYGDLPDDSLVLETLIRIENRLVNLAWTIDPKALKI